MTKVTKLLLLMDRGEVGQFVGKTLDQINPDGQRSLYFDSSNC